MSFYKFARLFAVFGVLIGGQALAAEDRYGSQKVVYHMNAEGGEEGERYRGALKNIQNQIDAVGKDKIEVKVVMHGDGVGLVKYAVTNQNLQMDVTSLKTQNVQFLVCNNTLTQRKISKDELFEVFDEDIVPSGVAELSYLQQQGYTYIKP